MDTYQQQGRACYKRGEYKKAVEHFDRALSRAASVPLLDNRAACQEKLGDLQAALQDAKKAIRHQYEDATGYLRAGRVLVKMGKQNVALQIYLHGLKKVRHVGQGYEMLRKLHQQLQDEVSPRKSVDPLTVLPPEIAEIILRYLSFNQRVNATRVSKQWMQFIRSSSSFWQHLDLSNARKKVPDAFISRAINASRGKLTAASLRSPWDPDKALGALARHCPLEELNLFGIRFTKRDSSEICRVLMQAKRLKILRFDVHSPRKHSPTDEFLGALSQTLEHLECNGMGSRMCDFQMQSYPKLKVFKGLLICEESVELVMQGRLSASMPALQTLDLSIKRYGLSRVPFLDGTVELQNLSDLQHLRINEAYFPVAALRLPHEIVTFDFTAALNANMARESGSQPTCLPHLRDLHLAQQNSVIEALALLRCDCEPNEPTSLLKQHEHKPMSKLKKFSIGSTRPESENLEHLLELPSHPRLTELEHLAIAIPTVEDQHVEDLVQRKLNLRLLDLSTTSISGVSVRAAVKAFPQLEELILNECPHLGRDAVNWARSQGIKVQARSADQTSGGKKVRY